MILAYRAAPLVLLWTPPAVLAWIPLLAMPIASFLIAAGYSSPNPTAVGGERQLARQPVAEATGIQTVTRHPILWGIALWAGSHLCIRGDLASIVLFLAILILALGGMRHIDLRREQSLGAEWGPIKLTTSALPFAAALQGRTKLDWAGIGWLRVLMGLAIYLALLVLHGPVLGIPCHPRERKGQTMSSNAEVAAKLLRDAADFFRAVAEQNPPLQEALSDNAKTFRAVADLVEQDPTGACPILKLAAEDDGEA